MCVRIQYCFNVWIVWELSFDSKPALKHTPVWSFWYHVLAHKITFDYITTELFHFVVSTTSFLPGIRRQWWGRSAGGWRREQGKRELFATFSFPSYPMLWLKIGLQTPAEHSFPAIDWPTEPAAQMPRSANNKTKRATRAAAKATAATTKKNAQKSSAVEEYSSEDCWWTSRDPFRLCTCF